MRGWSSWAAVAAAVVCCDSSGKVASSGFSAGGSTSMASSSTGPKTCMATELLCGDQCVPNDAKNCATCGNSCGAGKCCEGTCVTTESCAFAVTSVLPLSGTQSGGDWITLTGNGFQPGMRVFLGDGRAPTMVKSATAALIQAPPGSAGFVDVRIEQGAAVATLPKAFEYTSAGLMKPWKDIPMKVVRGENPGMAVLQDGRVLVAGGTKVPDDPTKSEATAELFLRDIEQMVPAKGPMQGSPRWQNNAVTLLTGKALIVGAACYVDATGCTGDPKAAHLYDPQSDTFVATKGALNKPRIYTRSVLMVDGRVLIASGNDPSIEIYDPTTDSFALINHTVLHRFGFVVRLRDGRVLIGAGDLGVTAAELFDPDTDKLSPTGDLKHGRSMLTAHTLPDGRVLAIGGASMSAGGIQDPRDSIDVYDPKSGTFSLAPYKLSIGRCWHASALVRDGTVLVMGGYTLPKKCDSSVGTVDQLDPIKNTVVPFDPLPASKRACEWNAVTLLDGSIVAVGGGACGTSQALPEVYFLPGEPKPT